jgi:hypothetical protein
MIRLDMSEWIDQQILFRALEKEDIRQIQEPILESICTRFKEQHGITLEIDLQAKELMADKGYKPEYGARELRRVVERELEMKLAEKLLNKALIHTENWRIHIISGKITIDQLLSEIDCIGCLRDTNKIFCTACFTGEYPINFPMPSQIPQMGLFSKDEEYIEQ